MGLWGQVYPFADVSYNDLHLGDLISGGPSSLELNPTQGNVSVSGCIDLGETTLILNVDKSQTFEEVVTDLTLAQSITSFSMLPSLSHSISPAPDSEHFETS